jgi:hypothetical protein
MTTKICEQNPPKRALPQKIKVKYHPAFNGEIGSVFTISFSRLKEMLEKNNRFSVDGFTVTEKGIDVFMDRLISADQSIKLAGKV